MPVEFNWSLEVDGGNPELAYLWDGVGADTITIEIVDLTFPVVVSGAGTTATDVTGTPPDGAITIVKGEKVFITGGPFTADLPITGSAGDQIFFAIGDPSFGLVVTIGVVGPIELVLVCEVGRLFAVTTIAVEGAPTIDSIAEAVDRNATLTVDVNELITEGDGPLIPGSLEITEPPAEGTLSLSVTGTLTYEAPDADDEVWMGLRVCGEAPAESGLSGPLCGAGTVTVTVGTGVPAGPAPARPPTGTPTPTVGATGQESAPAAPAMTGEPTFTG